MKAKSRCLVCPQWHPFSAVCWLATILLCEVLVCSAQTNGYAFSGSETNITLTPGLYQITAYGGQGANGGVFGNGGGGLGAEMSAEFSFSGVTTLTLVVGGAGSHQYGGAGGGGGGSFVVNGSTPLIIAGGGGGGASFSVPEGNGGNGLISGGSGGGGYSGGGSYSGGGGGGYSGDGGGNGAAYGGGYGGHSFLNGGDGGAGNGGGGAGGYGGGGSGGGAYNEGGGGGGGYSGGNGGFGFHGPSSPSYGGSGGSSYIDSSAIRTLTVVSGIASPDASGNGLIIITVVSQPGTLSYHVTDGNLVLDWAQGTLLSCGTPHGTYTSVNGASSPYTNSMSGTQRYFRVLVGINPGVSQKQ
jgi:hypothetical protein